MSMTLRLTDTEAGALRRRADLGAISERLAAGIVDRRRASTPPPT